MSALLDNGLRYTAAGHEDLKLTDMGAPINARMGLNTWAPGSSK